MTFCYRVEVVKFTEDRTVLRQTAISLLVVKGKGKGKRGFV